MPEEINIPINLNAKNFTQPLGKITGNLKNFDSALEASNARVLAFGASAAIIGGVARAFKSLATATISVEKNFVDINRILNLTNQQFERFGKNLFDISRKTATSFDDVSTAALEFARQGLSTTETLKRTADALTLVRLTGINAKKAVDSLTATVNSFTSQSIDMNTALNKFVAVETKYAVAARDLVEGLSRVGSSAVDAKVKFDELNGLIASVQQTTGRGGAVIGNAFKTIFLRVQRSSTLDALESFNIAVRDIQGNTLPAIAILKNLSDSYKTLSDSNQSYLREQVAGVFQANILSAILKDLGTGQSVFSQATLTSANATDEASQATSKLNVTSSAMLTQVGNSLVELQQNIGKVTFEPVLKGILGPLQTAFNFINENVDGDIMQGLFKGLKNIAIPTFTAGLILLTKLTKNLLVGLKGSLPPLIGITTEKQKQILLEERLLADLLANKQSVDNILGSERARRIEIRNITQEYGAQAVAIARANQAIKRVSPVLVAGGLSVKGGVLTKKSAGGFIPNLLGESRDISKGVGGAPRSAKPVVIPGFNFGGGKKGTMIANTSEVMVKNFNSSGGSAILNRNMMGGASRAAGGFSPISTSELGGIDLKGLNKKKRPNDYARALSKLTDELNRLIKSHRKGSISTNDLNKETDKLLKTTRASGKSRERLTKSIDQRVEQNNRFIKRGLRSVAPLPSSALGALPGAGAVSAKEGRLSKIADKFQKHSIGFLLAAPLLAGAADQMIGGKAGSAISSGVTGAITGGLVGASFGGIGAPVGAALGGVSALAFSLLGDEAEDLAKQFQELSDKTRENADASEKFIEAFKMKGNSSSASEYRDAISTMESSLKNINDIALRTSLETASSVSEMDEIRDKAVKKGEKERDLKEVGLFLKEFKLTGGKVSKTFQEASEDLGSIPIAMVTKTFSEEEKRLNVQALSPIFSSLLSAGETPESLRRSDRNIPGGLISAISRTSSAKGKEDLVGIAKGLEGIQAQLGGSQMFENDGDLLLKAFQKYIDTKGGVGKGASDAEERGFIRERIGVGLKRQASRSKLGLAEEVNNIDLKKRRSLEALAATSAFRSKGDTASLTGSVKLTALKEKRSAVLGDLGRQLAPTLLKAVNKLGSISNDLHQKFIEQISLVESGSISQGLIGIQEVLAKSGKTGRALPFSSSRSSRPNQGLPNLVDILEQFQGGVSVRPSHKISSRDIDPLFTKVQGEEDKKNILLANFDKQEKNLLAANDIEESKAKNLDEEKNLFNIAKGLSITRATQDKVEAHNLDIRKRLFERQLSSPDFGFGLSSRGEQSKRFGLQRKLVSEEKSAVNRELQGDIFTQNISTAENISGLLDQTMTPAQRDNILTSVASTGQLPTDGLPLPQNGAVKDQILLGGKRIHQLEEIVRLRNKELDAIQKENEIEQRRLLNQNSSFQGGLASGFNSLLRDSETIFNRLGNQLPLQMRNGLVGAMEDALDKSQSLGDSLRGMAHEFLGTIRRAFLKKTAGSLVNSVSSIGSPFKGFTTAQNGAFIPGNRTGDRNLALLEDGEYVLNRNAVTAMGGQAALNDINFGSFPRFNKGGAASVNEAVPNGRLSGFFLAGNNPELAEQRSKQRASLNKVKDGNNLLQMLITTAISGLASSAAGAFSRGPSSAGTSEAAFPSATPEFRDAFPSTFDVSTRQQGGMIRRFQSGGSTSPSVAGSTKNDISINIDMGNNTSTSTTRGGDSATQAKEFAQKIKAAVTQVMDDERRIGGRASSTARRA